MSRRDALSRTDIRRYYRALPRAARHNLRVNATAGTKALLTTAIPWCAPFLGMFLGAGLAFFDVAAGVLGAMVGFVIGLVAGYVLIQQVEAVAILDYIRKTSHAGRLRHCPLCGYDQRGIAASRCPECGCEIQIAEVGGRKQVGARE